MIITDTENLLFIEPANDASFEPVIDDLTRIAAAALATSEEYDHTRGAHVCTGCGRGSSSCSYRLPGGLSTHALLVHYLAFHRDEVPASELARIAALPVDGQEPTEEQLTGGTGGFVW